MVGQYATGKSNRNKEGHMATRRLPGQDEPGRPTAGATPPPRYNIHRAHMHAGTHAPLELASPPHHDSGTLELTSTREAQTPAILTPHALAQPSHHTTRLRIPSGKGLVAQPQLITHGDEVGALRTTTRADCEPQFVKDLASSSTRSSPYDGASPGAAGTTDPRTRSESTSIRVSSLARRSGASEDLA